MTSVLLVEDSATVRHLLTSAMRERGITVRTVEDGDEVLATAHEMKPDVIMINKMLPHRDGNSLLPELRKDADLKGVRIMMLTDAKSPEDVVGSIERGADDYVIKPFDPAAVAERVEKLAASRG